MSTRSAVTIVCIAAGILAMGCNPVPPCYSIGDPPITECRSPSPVFEFDWTGNVEVGEIDGFRLYWKRPGDLGWTQAKDFFCMYYFDADGIQYWVCPSLSVGFPIQRYLPTLPGTEYQICISAWHYDHSLGDDLETECSIGTDQELGLDTFCIPEYWLCDQSGCSQVRI